MSGSVERDQLFERRRELQGGRVNTKKKAEIRVRKKGVWGRSSRVGILFPQIGLSIGMIHIVQISERHSQKLEHIQNNIPAEVPVDIRGATFYA